MKVISIGRDDECTIVFPDNTISRRHAVLKIYATGRMELIDMGQNGTFVNGVKLNPNIPYPVSRKDIVSFAHVRQLDWSQVPDYVKYFRYILILCVLVAVVVCAIILWDRFGNKDSALPSQTDNSAVESVSTEESEEKATEENEASGKESVEMKDKSKVIPSDFFKEKEKGGEKKEPVDQDQDEDKENNPQQQSEEKKDNNNRIIM